MQSTYIFAKYIYLCQVHIAMQSTYIYAKYIYLCQVHIAMQIEKRYNLKLCRNENELVIHVFVS